MMVNKKIAGILGADEEDIESATTTSEVKNAVTKAPVPANLPAHYTENGEVNHEDIDLKILEAEYDLDRITSVSLQFSQRLLDEIEMVQPNHRARNVEVATGLMKIALDSVAEKIRTQEKKREQRMKGAQLEHKSDNKGMKVGNMNVLVGNHSEIVDAVDRILGESSDEDS